MGTDAFQTLQGAKDYWATLLSAGSKSGKLSGDSLLAAQIAGEDAAAAADGWFSAGPDEALAFWSSLDEWLPTAALPGAAEVYLRTCLDAIFKGSAEEARIEEDSTIINQSVKKVEDATAAVQDTIVAIGEDPSGLWALAGAGSGAAIGSIIPGVGTAAGAAIGGAGGFVAGKLKKAGIL